MTVDGSKLHLRAGGSGSGIASISSCRPIPPPRSPATASTQQKCPSTIQGLSRAKGSGRKFALSLCFFGSPSRAEIDNLRISNPIRSLFDRESARIKPLVSFGNLSLVLFSQVVRSALRFPRREVRCRSRFPFGRLRPSRQAAVKFALPAAVELFAKASESRAGECIASL
jgi:hypothetical protein